MKITWYRNSIKYGSGIIFGSEMIFDTLSGQVYVVRTNPDGSLDCETREVSILSEIRDKVSYNDVNELLKWTDRDSDDALTVATIVKSFVGRISGNEFPSIPSCDSKEIEYILKRVENGFNSLCIVMFKDTFRRFDRGTYHIAKKSVHDGLAKVKHDTGFWCYVPEEYIE